MTNHSNPVVLLVEDEEATRQLMRRILQTNGYRVVEARTGAGALALLSMGLPLDLLVADLHLPDIDGDEIARQFRIAKPDLEVLYVTSAADDLFADRAMLWEGEAFLEKPFTKKGLLEAVSLRLCGHLEPTPDPVTSSRRRSFSWRAVSIPAA